jgi:outer membrane receptor protein involved in Fe transport
MQDWYGDTGLRFYNLRQTLTPSSPSARPIPGGAFFDDQWSVSNRLTVNLGLRFDRMTTKYGVGKVYDFVTSPEGINGPPPVLRDRASTENVFDFKTWAPRLGVSYMLTEDGKTVRAGFLWALLPADQRREPETIRP